MSSGMRFRVVSNISEDHSASISKAEEEASQETVGEFLRKL
jgi:hypothetical protein